MEVKYHWKEAVKANRDWLKILKVIQKYHLKVLKNQ